MSEGGLFRGRGAGRPWVAFAVLAAIVAACNGDTTAPGAPEEEWESVDVITGAGPVLREHVTYFTDGLLVTGRICRPNGPGRRSTLVWSHGGFAGFTEFDDDLCRNLAQLGYVVFMPGFRGQDGGEGEVEACHGEVDDLLEMLRIGRTQRYVDGNRVVLAGGSHGGCIALRAVQRGAQVRAVAALAAPTDWASLHAFYADSVAHGSPATQARYAPLLAQIEEGFGGTPAQVPAAYAERSPVNFAAALNAAGRPVFLGHGVLDDYVPATQSCMLAAAAGAFTNLHVRPDGSVQASTPAPCAGLGLTWSPGPRPTLAWPAARYFLAYEGEGHELDGPAATMVVNDVLTFLSAKLP